MFRALAILSGEKPENSRSIHGDSLSSEHWEILNSLLFLFSFQRVVVNLPLRTRMSLRKANRRRPLQFVICRSVR